MLLIRDFRKKNTDWKWRDGKRYSISKWNEKKVGVAILTSDLIDFKKKTVIKDKEELYIMRKGSIQQKIQHLYIYMCMHPRDDHQDI